MTKPQSIDSRHSELNHQANKALAWLIAGCILLGYFGPRAWHSGEWHHALVAAVGLFGFLFGGAVYLISISQGRNLARHEEKLKAQAEEEAEQDRYESVSRPAHMVIEHVEGNRTRIDYLGWDMDDFEAGAFAHAVWLAEWQVTRPIIKQGTDIRNINDRYGAWMAELERVGGAERIGNRYRITEDGEEILKQYLPHSD